MTVDSNPAPGNGGASSSSTVRHRGLIRRAIIHLDLHEDYTPPTFSIRSWASLTGNEPSVTVPRPLVAVTATTTGTVVMMIEADAVTVTMIVAAEEMVRGSPGRSGCSAAARVLRMGARMTAAGKIAATGVTIVMAAAAALSLQFLTLDGSMLPECSASRTAP